jgi:hypothetical protein
VVVKEEVTATCAVLGWIAVWSVSVGSVPWIRSDVGPKDRCPDGKGILDQRFRKWPLSESEKDTRLIPPEPLFSKQLVHAH